MTSRLIQDCNLAPTAKSEQFWTLHQNKFMKTWVLSHKLTNLEYISWVRSVLIGSGFTLFLWEPTILSHQIDNPSFTSWSPSFLLIFHLLNLLTTSKFLFHHLILSSKIFSFSLFFTIFFILLHLISLFHQLLHLSKILSHSFSSDCHFFCSFVTQICHSPICPFKILKLNVNLYVALLMI